MYGVREAMVRGCSGSQCGIIYILAPFACDRYLHVSEAGESAPEVQQGPTRAMAHVSTVGR